MEHLVDMYGAMLVDAILIHLGYVVISVMVGGIAGVVLGVGLSRLRPKYADAIVMAISVLQSIPSIVFVGVFFIWWGMVPASVIIALAVYAVFPVVKSTMAGLSVVDEQYLEAARGCGMNPIQTLWKVELPLALPAIFSGLRIAVIYTVSWAVLASMIGMGGLGDFVYQGINSNNHTLILIGAVPAAIMAIVLCAIVDAIQKKVITYIPTEEKVAG